MELFSPDISHFESSVSESCEYTLDEILHLSIHILEGNCSNVEDEQLKLKPSSPYKSKFVDWIQPASDNLLVEVIQDSLIMIEEAIKTKEAEVLKEKELLKKEEVLKEVNINSIEIINNKGKENNHNIENEIVLNDDNSENETSYNLRRKRTKS